MVQRTDIVAWIFFFRSVYGVSGAETFVTKEPWYIYYHILLSSKYTRALTCANSWSRVSRDTVYHVIPLSRDTVYHVIPWRSSDDISRLAFCEFCPVTWILWTCIYTYLFVNLFVNLHRYIHIRMWRTICISTYICEVCSVTLNLFSYVTQFCE